MSVAAAGFLMLLAPAIGAAAASAGASELDAYGEVVYALQWTSCCEDFRGDDLDRIHRRIDAIRGPLEVRHGADAVQREHEQAVSDATEEIGLWDPVKKRKSAAEQLATRRGILRWYDTRLDRLEAQLAAVKQ